MITVAEDSLLRRIKAALLAEMQSQVVRQCDLARKMGLKQQEVVRIMNVDHNTKLETLEAAFAALGKKLDLRVVSAAPAPACSHAVHQLAIHLSREDCSSGVIRRAARNWREARAWGEAGTPTHWVTADADAGFEDLPGFVAVERFPEEMAWALSLNGVRGMFENCFICVVEAP